ncbi:alpha/beta hydrolase [Actinoplanes sp. NPDC049599]|uniref:alpha/beta hydrolase n=1 Tax=Actinoplanes sp. NPDC049599 TaxID=3363903 RepID=UPI003798FFF4
MTEIPEYLRPFVLSPPARKPERTDTVDTYVPDGAGPFPVVVVVHGAPLPPGLETPPRDWPLYRGYGELLAAEGMLTVVPGYQLPITPGPDGLVLDYATAAARIAAAVTAARADPRADPDRVVLWFFSGGGMLSAGWLRDAPPWLRGVALTYPVVTPLPGMAAAPGFDAPAEAVGEGAPPLLLTRVGREHPGFAAGVADFLTQAAAVEIIDVPHGQHSFDIADHTDESRAAVRRAVGWVRERQAV